MESWLWELGRGFIYVNIEIMRMAEKLLLLLFGSRFNRGDFDKKVFY